MKIAVIQSSQLGDRWDAGFHILTKELAGRVEQLQQDPTLTPDLILARIMALPTSVHQSLLVLSRNQVTHLNSAAVTRIVAEYPFLALAQIEAQLPVHAAVIQERIAQDQAALAQLSSLTESNAPDAPTAPATARPRP